jgi:hypothetical protein
MSAKKSKAKAPTMTAFISRRGGAGADIQVNLLPGAAAPAARQPCYFSTPCLSKFLIMH